MAYWNPGYQSAFQLKEFDGLNFNDSSTATGFIDVRANNFISWQVIQDSNAINCAVTSLEVSFDESTIFSTAEVLSGAGVKNGVRVSEPFIRIRVRDAQGAAATANIIITAK